MDNYLIPANSKKGQLIFNIFRWSDLLLLIMGAFVTVILTVSFLRIVILSGVTFANDIDFNQCA